MVPLLEQLQTALGPIGYASALVGVGLIVGIVIGLISRPKPPAETTSPTPSTPAVTPVASPTPTAAAKFESKGASSEKRRNPRRAGRSVEVFIAVPGHHGEPIKGVVLDRSVGGLGILVGDEYTAGSIIGVLPTTATKLTPWVEVEVKSCRQSGEDWEIGVQFLKVPPYSTMVLFG